METSKATNFSRIPNQVLEKINYCDFTKNELKCALVLCRIKFGCHTGQYPIKLKYVDLTSANLSQPKVKKILLSLEKKGYVKPNYNDSGHLKSLYFDTDKITNIDVENNNNHLRLKKLIGKNLPRKTSQKSNNKLTKTYIPKLPEREDYTYQNDKLLENRVRVNTSSQQGMRGNVISLKDILKDKIKDTDKESKSPLNNLEELEYASKEIQEALEPDKPESFQTYKHYVSKVGISRAHQYKSEVLQDYAVKNKGAVFVTKCKEYLKSKEDNN